MLGEKVAKPVDECKKEMERFGCRRLKEKNENQTQAKVSKQI